MSAWPNASVSTASKYCSRAITLVALANHRQPMLGDLLGGQRDPLPVAAPPRAAGSPAHPPGAVLDEGAFGGHFDLMPTVVPVAEVEHPLTGRQPGATLVTRNPLACPLVDAIGQA